MRTDAFEREKKDGEKGIALIVTLGILSILIVVALAFAASARTSRKAAATHASVTAARLIAESALEKVTGLIRYYNTNNGSLKVSELASMTRTYNPSDPNSANVPNEGKQDWLYRIFAGDTDADKLAQLTDPSGDPTVEWEYVVVDGKIRGRVAYTLQAKAKVNPARIVDNSTKYPNAIGSPLVRDEKNDPQPRIGIDVNEMRLGDLPNMSSYANDISNFNSTAASPAGQLTDDGDWPDIDYLCSKLGVSGTGKAKFKEDWFRTNACETKEGFWVDDNDNDKIDANGTAATGGTDNDDEMYCRFNLRRYVDNNNNGVYDAGDTNLWNDLAQNDPTYKANLWPSLTRNDSNDVEYLLQVPKRIDDPSAAQNDTGGIMWFAKWGITLSGHEAVPGIVNGQTFYHVQGYRSDLPASNEQKVQYARHMMAANLIDYCDSDSVPTSCLDPRTWSGASWPNNCPQWYGREKVRYCNECLFECEATPYKLTDGSGNQQNRYSISITVECETVDIYPGNLPDVDVYLTAKIKITYTRADGTNGIKEYNYVDELIDGAPTATTNNDFITTLKVLESADVFGDSTYLAGNTPPEITSIDGCVYAVIIKDHAGGYGVDYHFGGHPVKSVSIKDGEKKTICWVSWNKDPRARSKYNRVDVTDNPNTLPYIPILGNNDKVPNPGHGKATPGANAAAPRDVATMLVVVDSGNSDPTKRYMQAAYIRDDIMKSPWELGFIHRPSPFQTLNLGLFNETDTNTLDNKHMRSGGNLLDNERITNTDMTVPSGDSACPYGGDANILSQVKMQPELGRFGLVDINTKQKDILKMLLSGITIGQTVEQMDDFTAGTPLDPTSTDVQNLVNNIASSNGAFRYRSEIANVPGLCDGTVFPQLDTSAKREEIIGKFINLTSTTSNDYRIIILAQTIKDVGGVTLYKDLNYDGKIDPSGAPDTYDADGDVNTSDTIDERKDTSIDTYDPMFDEITAEQKIAIDIAYDATANKWKILKYEFMDD